MGTIDLGEYCICDSAYTCRGLVDPTCRHEALEDLLEALYEARDELERWGYGDDHYGAMPGDQRVLEAIAKIDRVLP